jgi:hypothetical protein
VNYIDTFAPVLDLATARLILVLSVVWKNPARHGDIPAAYTKAHIESDSDIYSAAYASVHGQSSRYRADSARSFVATIKAYRYKVEVSIGLVLQKSHYSYPPANGTRRGGEWE